MTTLFEARRPDIVLFEKKEKRCAVIDNAILADVRCSEREIQSREISEGLQMR